MNDLKTAVLKLSNGIKKIPCVRQYIFLSNQIKNNKEIIDLKEKLKNATRNGDIDYLNKLKIEFDSHPLINNYKIIKKEVFETLSEIKEQIDIK